MGSSLVGEADLHSNILPAGEKVAVREAREAGKDQGKKKTDLKKKSKGKKKNPDRINKRKQSRKLGKGKKNTNPTDKKKKKKNKNKKGKKKADKKKKTRKNKNTQKEKKEKKEEKRQKKKDRRKKKKLLNKKRKNGVGSVGRQAAGGDWSSCGTTGVNDTCLINAVNALNFEKGQIQNFFKQKARLENQNS